MAVFGLSINTFVVHVLQLAIRSTPAKLVKAYQCESPAKK